MSESEDKHDVKGQFESQATQSELGVIAEFIAFLKYNKKWWLTPIVVALLLIAILAISAGTGAAPFIYTLFLFVSRPFWGISNCESTGHRSCRFYWLSS